MFYLYLKEINETSNTSYNKINRSTTCIKITYSCINVFKLRRYNFTFYFFQREKNPPMEYMKLVFINIILCILLGKKAMPTTLLTTPITQLVSNPEKIKFILQKTIEEKMYQKYSMKLKMIY